MKADGTVLGFDVGRRRIGVAVGSVLGGGARPVAVIDVHDDAIDWPALDRVFREWRPDGCVVGDPMTMAGDDQPIRQFAREFAQSLGMRFHVSVVMVDERRSSIEAAHAFAERRAGGRARRRDAHALDAMAAAIIVERWLSSPGEGVAILPGEPDVH